MEYIVFIIDDNELYSAMLSYYLRKDKEIKILMFDCTEDALLYEGNTPNVILLDHHLKGDNGLLALPLLQEKFKDTKIIAMSAQDNFDVILQYIDKGITDYVEKNSKAIKVIIEIIHNLKHNIRKPKKYLKQIFSKFKEPKD